MLYVIHESVAGLFSSGNAQAADITGIEYLTLGVAEGSHRIGGSRKTLLTLAGQVGLPERTRKVFQRAANRSAQDGGLRYSLTTYGLVEASPGACPSSRMQANQRIISFPLQWFDVSSKVQPTMLLGENLSDVRVLELIAKTAIVATDIKFLPIRYKGGNGGGSTTRQVLEAAIEDNQNCICIVDSDRASPNGILGSTASSVQPYKDAAAYPTADVIETRGRDLENCLPARFYRAEYRSHTDYSPLSSLLDQLSTTGEDDIRFHLDIEKGLFLKNIFNYPINSADRSFWNAKLPAIRHLISIPGSSASCITSSACLQSPTTNCSCVIVKGNPQNILDHFHAKHASDAGHPLAALLTPSEKDEWVRLGLSIASWCCADDRMRA